MRRLTCLIALAGCGDSESLPIDSDTLTSGSSESTTTNAATSTTDPTDTTTNSTTTSGSSSSTTADTTGDTDPGCSTNDDCAATPDTPVCDNQNCVVCTADDLGACEATNEVCDPDAGACIPCSTHADCGDRLACHLDGPDAGFCFDPAEDTYVQANDVTELTAAFTNAASGDDIVVELVSLDNYLDVELTLAVDAELVLVGDYDQFHADHANGVVQLSGGAILYTHQIQFVNNYSGTIIDCDGATLWAHQTLIEDADQVGLNMTNGCAAHLFQSQVKTNLGDGIDMTGATTTLELVNSFVGTTADQNAIDIADGSATILYSTIGSNTGTTRAIQCTSGSATVRNSIVMSKSTDAPVACASTTIDYSSVEGGFAGTGNESIGDPQDAWFETYDSGRFHLQPGHPFGAVAQWQDGDPAVDYDGEPRAGVDATMEIAGADLP